MFGSKMETKTFQKREILPITSRLSVYAGAIFVFCLEDSRRQTRKRPAERVLASWSPCVWLCSQSHRVARDAVRSAVNVEHGHAGHL